MEAHDSMAAEALALRLSIGRISRRIRRIFTDSGEGAAFLELGILDRLSRVGATSPSSLSDDEGVTSAAIAEILRGLESRGLVARDKDPHDGRRVVVTLTASGAASLADRDAAVLSRLHKALQEVLSAGERAALPQLVTILEKVERAL